MTQKTKKFNGRTYHKIGKTHRTKKTATKSADYARGHKYPARIIKGKTGYEVYVDRVRQLKTVPKRARPKYFVTMSDKMFSGHGSATGKVSKFVIECDSEEQARRMKRLASQRKEMQYISIHRPLPKYDKRKYHVSIKKAKEIKWRDLPKKKRR